MASHDPTEKARVDRLCEEAGKIIPPDLVATYIEYMFLLGIPLVRIKGPKADPSQDAQRAGKAPSSWQEPKYWLRKPVKRPQPGTYWAGVCTHRSGIVLLDVDVADDNALEHAYGPIPEGWLASVAPTTLTVRTGGGRWHLWFRWPVQETAETWPRPRTIHLDERGKIELKSDGVGVVPPGFVGHDLVKRHYVPVFVDPLIRSLADLPPEAVEWFRGPSDLEALAARVEDQLRSAAVDSPGSVTLQDQSAAEMNTGGGGGLVVPMSDVTAASTPTSDAVSPLGDQHASSGREQQHAVVQEPARRLSLPRWPLAEHPGFRRLLENASADDSKRDWAIACFCIRVGYTFADFTSEVGRLPRRKPEKATHEGYLTLTWNKAVAYLAESPDNFYREPGSVEDPLTDGESASLQEALWDRAVVDSLTERQFEVLCWLVAEAVRLGSGTIYPGVKKLGDAVGIGPSEAGRHLRNLREYGLLGYHSRGGDGKHAKAIVVRALIDPDEANPTPAGIIPIHPREAD